MARLIVVDASVAIAALSADDAHDDAGVAVPAEETDDEWVIAATTRTEILLDPSRIGATALATRGTSSTVARLCP